MRTPILQLIIKASGYLFLVVLLSCNNAGKKTETRTTEPSTTETITQETITTENVPGTDKPTTGSTDPSTLNLRFLDVTTGFLVIPQSVFIQQREDRSVTRKLSKENVAENGTIAVKLPNGTYDVTVNANQYDPMSSFFQLNNQSLNVNFNLEPVTPPLELSAEYIKRSHRPDAVFVVGFVVDDHSGKPMEGVKISSKDKAVTYSSLKDGYFQLRVPLPDNAAQIDERNMILFEKVQYITEVRKNFDMWPNGDMILQIRLKKGTGVHEEDIIKNRKASVSIKN